MLSILTQFLSNRLQHVMVDGCRKKIVYIVSGVPHGSILGQLLFPINGMRCPTVALFPSVIYSW